MYSLKVSFVSTVATSDGSPQQWLGARYSPVVAGVVTWTFTKLARGFPTSRSLVGREPLLRARLQVSWLEQQLERLLSAHSLASSEDVSGI